MEDSYIPPPLAEHPIAIIGGGLAGLALSIGLTRHGIPHRIYESAPAFSEIGAGIALGPNSAEALHLIDEKITAGIEQFITYNEGIETDEERRSAFAFSRVGMEDGFSKLIAITKNKSSSAPGRSCIHRAKFLDELIKLVPPSAASFGKTLVSITDPEVSNGGSEPLSLSFADGSTVKAAAVIACDGIKSTVRRTYILSEDDPKTRQPAFVNEYAYRGLFPKAKFLDLTKGEINPGVLTLYCGYHGYIVMYPVEKGRLINMVAVKRLEESSARSSQPDETTYNLPVDDENWIQLVTKEGMLDDFAGWGEPLRNLLAEIPRAERWALHDHLSARTYIRGRVAIMGDAAHAMVPHQGQGAGQGFEDAFILSSILGEVLKDRSTKETPMPAMSSRVGACLQAYDQVRRRRTQEVARTSREMGKLIAYCLEGIGDNHERMRENLEQRMDWIFGIDLEEEVQRGLETARGILEDANR